MKEEMIQVYNFKKRILRPGIIPYLKLYKNERSFDYTRKKKSYLTTITSKQVFDIAFSLTIAISVFPWLFPIIALAIKISSPGPVLFIQKRTGINNGTFRCLKFRTMHINDKADTLQAEAGDSRITPVGKFLRKTNLDELPQFINVLLGHMSVVGPRPHMVKHTEEYSKIIPYFMLRHLVKPGITGWAQINGYRGPTTQLSAMENRVKSDLWYIKKRNMMLDLKIVAMTAYKMLSGEKNVF